VSAVPAHGLPPVTHVLYLHGFRSGPRSTKAERMRTWLAEHRPEATWWCPQLPASPQEALDLCLAGTAGWPPATTAVFGSSLGGWYATVLAERLGCRAVLLNPAIEPARDLAPFADRPLTTWDGDEPFDFRAAHLDELRANAAPAALAHPERVLAVVATGDELLDWREMKGRYPGSTVRVVEGSDHGLSDFEDHLPAIAAFCGWTPGAGA
jgi:predicted esterase YcpF (UPF0227 family)